MNSPSRPRIPIALVIEDEPVLRAAMARGLRAAGDLEVLEAGTLNDGLALLDSSSPSVLVCDIDLPDRSGVEIIGELARRSLQLPVLFVSAYLSAYRSVIPRHAKVDVLEKPVPMTLLRERVRALVGDLAARSQPFAVADYIQIACLSRRSVLVEVASGPYEGEVAVVEGALWFAADLHGVGEQAFKRICFVDEGVACTALPSTPPERNIFEGWEALMLDAARERDEYERDSIPAPRPPSGVPQPRILATQRPLSGTDLASLGTIPPAPPPAITPPVPVPASEPPAPARTFDDAWDEAIAAMLRKDLHAAATAFLAAASLRPEDPRVVANLKRLEDMGVLPPGSR